MTSRPGKKAGLRIGSGDALLVRTGPWARVKAKGDLNLNVKAPGLYASCARWLKERDTAILGSDAVQDVRPSRVEGVNQPIHQILLVAEGTPLARPAEIIQAFWPLQAAWCSSETAVELFRRGRAQRKVFVALRYQPTIQGFAYDICGQSKALPSIARLSPARD